MGRPRKYKRPVIECECETCGKKIDRPYIYTKMPSATSFTYTKGGEKTARSQIDGAEITFHCDTECYKEYLYSK